jgi:DNA-binding FadR family transcriptional regulator
LANPASLVSRPQVSRSEEIAGLLRDDILAGQYRAGERLPSERDLAARFRTSRGVVREAFKRLEQLGLAAIQPGGARAVPVESCTLDVLGPLLDLGDLPDPKLVDEVLEIFGVLMERAARAAVHKATDTDLEHAQQIIDEMLSASGVERHQAMRRLGTFFVDIADHLVLRLTINGLRTTFMARMRELGIRPDFDSPTHGEIAAELRAALGQRNPARVGDTMRRLNRFFRDGAREALLQARADKQRIHA